MILRSEKNYLINNALLSKIRNFIAVEITQYKEIIYLSFFETNAEKSITVGAENVISD